MNQLVIGATAPFLVAVVIYARQRGRAGVRFLILTPLMMAAGAVWAVIPDIPRLLGRSDLYYRMFHHPLTNIFFFHNIIDRHETDSVWWSVLFLVMVAVVLFMAWRELRRLERRRWR